MKRFWKHVAVDPERGVLLDDRPVRTPGRNPLLVPSAALAEAIAEEWRAVIDDIDPRTMPLTGLTNAAIDRVSPDPEGFAAGLAAYGETDLLCYRAEGPLDLVERQAALWDPPLDWARERYDVHFEIATGIMHRAQPEATIERLGTAIAARPAFELAPLTPIVTITGSLVLALALAERAMPADAAWTAANLDEDWQAEKWGLDDLAIDARETRRRDFEAAVRFLSLVA
jgi:chaperone required for assembly of F1-ATPase